MKKNSKFLVKNVIVVVFFIFQLNHTLYSKTEDSTSLNSNVDKIYTIAEVMPSFPGGSSELMKFLSQNILYPNIAREKYAEGKVIVNFYIDIDGSIKNPIIVKDLVGYGCAEEVLRIIDLMPKWIPGTQGGKPAKVYYTLPVTFKLK